LGGGDGIGRRILKKRRRRKENTIVVVEHQVSTEGTYSGKGRLKKKRGGMSLVELFPCLLANREATYQENPRRRPVRLVMLEKSGQ